jgi:hypothetical protein
MSMRKSSPLSLSPRLSPSWPAAAERRKLPRPRPPARLPPPPPPTRRRRQGIGIDRRQDQLRGTAPAPEKIKVSADPYCQKEHKDGLERKVVDVKDGGLKDVFVYVKSGLTTTYPPPTEAVELDQQGCMYKPHIVVLQVGQPLKIKNNDETLHNIHPRPAVNQEFNIGQPRKGMESTKTFDKKEVMIPVGCDVHPGCAPTSRSSTTRSSPSPTKTASSRSRDCRPANTRSRPCTRS